MELTNNLKISWKNGLRQAFEEQDVLELRSQLKLIRKQGNENFRNYSMTEMKEKK